MKKLEQAVGIVPVAVSRCFPVACVLGSRFVAIVIGAGLAGTAKAELQLSPYLSAQREYQSNVFAVTGRDEARAENNGDTTLADSVSEGRAGANVIYNRGLQTFQATAEGRRYVYDHFDRLNHNEYLLGSRLKWVTGPIVDGTLNFRQELRLSPFEDRNTTELDLDRDREIGETINLMATPRWRLETGFHNHRLDAPQAEGSFVLNENYGDLALKYSGSQKLQAGVKLEYVSGNYVDQTTETTTRFHQATAEATLDYVEKDFSILSGSLGYTERRGDQAGPSSASGITGSFGYSRVLTAKTTVDLDLHRRIYSYRAGVNSIIDSGVGVGLLWKATAKITMTGRYDWVQDVFYGPGLADDPTTGRKDRNQVVTLKADYQVLEWLLIRPYGRYRTRASTSSINEYDQSVAGLELRGDFGGPSAINAGYGTNF